MCYGSTWGVNVEGKKVEFYSMGTEEPAFLAFVQTEHRICIFLKQQNVCKMQVSYESHNFLTSVSASRMTHSFKIIVRRGFVPF